MLFPTAISASIVGFAALAAAAPHPHALANREASQPAERGLVWVPRNAKARRGFGFGNGFNNGVETDFITITELVQTSSNQNNADFLNDLNANELLVEELNQAELNSESDFFSNNLLSSNGLSYSQSDVELTILLENQLDEQSQFRFAQDNVRQNHYRNSNPNVNTVVVVVSNVIDSRDSNNVNTRYLTRQLQIDNGASEQVVVVVSEIQQLTISNALPTNAGFDALQAAATGTGVPAVATYDPSAAFEANNATQILPIGVAAPFQSGFNVQQDPAIILLQNQDAVVEIIES